MRSKKDKLSSTKLLYISLGIEFILILISFLIFTIISGREIRNNNHQYLVNDTKEVADSFDVLISEGNNNIKVLSELISETLDFPNVNVGNYQKLINDSVFDFLEFADKNGVDHNITGGTSDATDRKYYLDAMEGNSGMEVIYNSRATHENLLMFYTPVYFDGDIIGSLIGVYQATNRVSELLSIDYFDEKATSYLCSADGRVFANNTSLNANEEIYIFDLCEERNRALIEDAIKDKKAAEFLVDGNKSTGYMMPVLNDEWFIVQIYPTDVNISMKYRMNEITLSLVAILLVLFFANMIIVYRANNRQEARVQEQLNILQSMADMYFSMQLIDLSDYSVWNYEINDEIKATLEKGVNAVDMMRSVMKERISDEYLERALEFSDVSTVEERMQGKKSISMDVLGKNVGWIRIQYVKIDTDSSQEDEKLVVFTVQVIDEEKRRELELFYNSHNDELTTLYNRRAYEEDTKDILTKDDTENLVVVSADVNGLKRVNDTLGHAAGDELIISAASCMKSTFGKYGKVYRTGGDEFIAILYADEANLENVKKEFNDKVTSWKGKLFDKLAISCGYVEYRNHKGMTFHEMETLADQLMYQAKSEYYVSNNIDRRRG